ncbi:hypothetical protein [Ruminococcus bicirculans (ex Wegman et al. 2014)]|uniref:hypothetical protein n=1 Tax=Ruminococcus bicirculans (ex Wegman et al. 2014) TaxID=1160721 RepID=UPI00366F4D06
MISVRISDNLFLAKYTMLSYSQSIISNVTLDAVKSTVRKGIKILAVARSVAEETIFDKIGRQMEGSFEDWCFLLYKHIKNRKKGNYSYTDFQDMLYNHTTNSNYADECAAISQL